MLFEENKRLYKIQRPDLDYQKLDKEARKRLPIQKEGALERKIEEKKELVATFGKGVLELYTQVSNTSLLN